jgi:exoribonuclease R
MSYTLKTKNYKEFALQHQDDAEPTIFFQEYKKAHQCLPGDKVFWNGSECTLESRNPHQHIPGVLLLNSKYIYGHTSRGKKIYLFQPFDPSYPPFRVGSGSLESINQLVLVDFADWDDHESMPRGALNRILGACGDPVAEKKALQWLYGRPATAKLPLQQVSVPFQTRRQLQGYTFNIDPPGCKDIDDVITLHNQGSNQWSFVITIADVAETVQPGSLLALRAYHMGQTLYQDGQAVLPMLPAALSEDLLSLLPGQPRLGVSLFCTWNSETKHLETLGFQESQLCNDASFTYESILKADKVFVTVLQEVASQLKGSKTSDPHEWVEMCMLFYNREAAKLLVKNNAGLLRTHKAADVEKVHHYNTLHPDLAILAMESAKYALAAPDAIHAGLGSMPYTHITSPIRRFADLHNQHVLKAIVKGHPVQASSNDEANYLTQVQKQSKKHDRALFFLNQILQASSGTVEGIVVSSTDQTTKLYIPAWKRIIKTEGSSLAPGVGNRVDYYANLQQPKWSDRMVFRLSTDGSGIAEHEKSCT